MTTLSEDVSLVCIVSENLDRAAVLDRFEIDYYKDGERSLRQACHEKGIQPEAVIRALADIASGPLPDLRSASMAYLTTHVVETHHAYMRNLMPRLGFLVDKIAEVHGANHPELDAVADTFHRFAAAAESHLAKEEGHLFPICLEVETIGSSALPASIREALSTHEATHQDLADELTSIRKLTAGYHIPEDACSTYELTMNKLAELESDLHLHLHKENNLLFSRLVG